MRPNKIRPTVLVSESHVTKPTESSNLDASKAKFDFSVTACQQFSQPSEHTI